MNKVNPTFHFGKQPPRVILKNISVEELANLP